MLSTPVGQRRCIRTRRSIALADNYSAKSPQIHVLWCLRKQVPALGVTTDTRIYTFLRSCHLLWHAPAKLVSATSQPRDNCSVGLQSSLHTCCSDHSGSFSGYSTKIPRSETHNTHLCVIARQSCFFLFLVWVLYNLAFLSYLSSIAWKGLWMISLFWKEYSFTIWQQS
jgi:hypothetical protein